MNKAQLVEALTTRIGDRRTAAAAVDGLVDVIVETVGSGSSVTLTGFGVFEPRRRAARVARNPRTGETVPVPETVVPSFRPGAAFREQIGNSTEAAEGATSAPRRSPRAGDSVSADAGSAQPARRTRAKSGTATAAPKTGSRAAPKKSSTSAPKTASRSSGAAASKSAPKTTPKSAPKTTETKSANGSTTKKAPAKGSRKA